MSPTAQTTTLGGRLARVVAAVAATVAAAAALVAPAAAQQAGAPTLTGETLAGFNGIIGDERNVNACNQNGGSYQFTTSGPAGGRGQFDFDYALGPYPGTFEERGVIRYGPNTVSPSPVTNGVYTRGAIVGFEATFTIWSGDTVITGRKWLEIPNGFFECANFGEPGNPSAHIRRTGIYTGPQVRYEATIRLADGTTYRDAGAAIVELNDSSVHYTPGLNDSSERFRENFFSDYPVAVPLQPAAVVLTPPAAVNPVGSTHTVTATATTSAGTPSAGVTVLFNVTGASSASGSCETDALGRCDFTYTGPQLPGADLITACADTNGNGTADPGEPCGTATKIWILPATTPGQVTGGGWLFRPTTEATVSFGFNAQSTDGDVAGNCNVIDHATSTHIKCISVVSLVVTPTHATFFGEATVDGARTTYRIDVDDLGEPGTADTFKVQTDSGYAAAGTLAGGNIQIRP